MRAFHALAFAALYRRSMHKGSERGGSPRQTGMSEPSDYCEASYRQRGDLPPCERAISGQVWTLPEIAREVEILDDFSDRLRGQGDARKRPEAWVFHVEDSFRSIDTEIASEVENQGVWRFLAQAPNAC